RPSAPGQLDTGSGGTGDARADADPDRRRNAYPRRIRHLRPLRRPAPLPARRRGRAGAPDLARRRPGVAVRPAGRDPRPSRSLRGGAALGGCRELCPGGRGRPRSPSEPASGASMTHRRLVHGRVPLLAMVVAAGCDSLLVEPAAGPEPAMIACDLDPTPGPDLGPGDADRAGIQVTRAGEMLLDTVVVFAPGSSEFSVPVRFRGASAQVQIRVELRREHLPVARALATTELRARRVNDVPLELGGPATVPLTPATGVSTGVYHTCATTGIGAFCWGTNERLQLGSEQGEVS